MIKRGSRIAAVIVVVVVQKVDGHCLVPGPHDGHVQLRNHSVANLIPPTALQHNLHKPRASRDESMHVLDMLF